MTGWKKIGDTWEKRFPTDGISELKVIVGQRESFINGLAFNQIVPGRSAEKDQPGTRLQDWMDSLSPEALIEIIAKRDKHVPDLPEGPSCP